MFNIIIIVQHHSLCITWFRIVLVSMLQSFEGSHLSELDVDDKSLLVLCQLGLHEACPRVHKLTLSCYGDVTADPIKMAYSSFHHLTELHVKELYERYSTPIHDPVSFCNAVQSSHPRLVKLSFSHVELGNERAVMILREMMAHPSLKSITWVGS